MIQGTTEQSVIRSKPSPPEGGGWVVGPIRNFAIASALLVVVFGKILFDLAVYGLKTDVYSYVLLVPFISTYLAWQLRRKLPVPRSARSRLSTGLYALGAITLAGCFSLPLWGMNLSRNDRLSLSALAFCFLFVGMAVHLLGKTFSKVIAFPLVFLFFMVPFPDKITAALETASQYASAEVYDWMMTLTGATYFREGRVFALPGLVIQVAQECSGIRSSLVLFITSLIAGHMFLRSPWKKVALAAFVFPLGIARNAFRIWTLSMLTIHWDPGVINSPLHHRGGPIFFVLSLIPFFLFLVWLRKTDSPRLSAAHAGGPGEPKNRLVRSS